MTVRLMLLPGMDGTGALFADFARVLPSAIEPQIISYPVDRFLSYPELMALVQAAIPASVPFVLFAESFSAPLAIQCAAANLPNLKALVICAGFARSPVSGLLRFTAWSLAPILLRFGLSDFSMKLLVGRDASSALINEVRAAIASVRPGVLAARLRAVLSCHVRHSLGQVRVPTLYIQASRDRLVPASCLAEIRQIQPSTEASVIDGPHLILQRKPRDAAQAVELFLRQLT